MISAQNVLVTVDRRRFHFASQPQPFQPKFSIYLGENMLFGDVGRSAVATSHRDRDLVSVRLKKAHHTGRTPPPPPPAGAPNRRQNPLISVDHDESRNESKDDPNATNRASRTSWRQSSASLFRPTSLFLPGSNWQDAINLQDYLERDSIELELPELQQEVDEVVQENAFLGENIRETYSLNKKWIQRLLRFVAFYAGGVYTFMRMEGWSLRTSIFFVTQTISTVGYGNIAPTSRSGRMFTIFYLLVGILITFSVLGDVTHYIVKTMRKNYSLPRKLSKLQLIVRHVINCLMWLCIMFSLFIVGALFFSYNENWSFEKALYFSVVTATSTGYGDIVPTKPASIWVNMAFILVGVSCTALAFEKISSFKRHLDCAELDQLLDAIELSPELLNAIDKTGRQRVSRAEYVLHMLQLAGKLGPGDILPWVQRFGEFDFDKDGVLTRADWLEYQAKRFSKAQDDDNADNIARVPGQSNDKSQRKKSLIMIITDETKDVLMETLKLKKTTSDEHAGALKEVIIQSPLQSAKMLKRASNYSESQASMNGVEMTDMNHQQRSSTYDEEKNLEMDDIYDADDDDNQRSIGSRTVSRKVSFIARSSDSPPVSPQHSRSFRMNGAPPPPPPPAALPAQQQQQQQSPRVSISSFGAGAPPPPPPPPPPPQVPRVSISSSGAGAPPPPPPPPSIDGQQRRGSNPMHQQHRRSIDDL